VRAAIYCRVSGKPQEDGYSLDEQERGCRQYAEQRGYPVVGVYREIYDGEEVTRPRLDALREAGKRGEVEVVIVYVQDRLARGADPIAIVLWLLDAAGIAPECVQEPFENDEIGIVMRTFRGMKSGIEKADIRRRTQGGRRARAQAGRLIPGATPLYGYRWRDAGTGKGQGKVAYAIEPNHAPIVRRIYAEIAGGKTLNAVARGLTADGIPTPGRSAQWNVSTIRKIATHPSYIGQGYAFDPRKSVRVKGPDGRKVWREVPRPAEEMIALPEGTIPPLVSEDEAAVVRERLAQNQRAAVRNSQSPESFLLRGGFVRCAMCGATVHGRCESGKTAGAAKRHVYAIQKTAWRHKQCASTKIAAAQLDSAVWDGLKLLLADDELIRREVARHRRTDPTAQDLAALDGALREVAAQQVNLTDAVAEASNAAVRSTLLDRLTAIADRQARIEQERAELLQQREAWQAAEAHLTSLEEWRATWLANLHDAGDDYAFKRLVLTELAVAVKLYPAAHEPRWEATSKLGAIANTRSRSGSPSRPPATAGFST